MNGFDTSNVWYMDDMFAFCSGLTSLDLSGFDTSNVRNMSGMFAFCSDLTTLYCGDGWTTDNVEDSYAMFSSCEKLVGGMGTVFDAAHTDKEYARADGGLAAPGYFTLKAGAPTRISAVEADGAAQYFSLDGRLQDGKRSGVNIVRRKNGMVKKVVVD